MRKKLIATLATVALVAYMGLARNGREEVKLGTRLFSKNTIQVKEETISPQPPEEKPKQSLEVIVEKEKVLETPEQAKLQPQFDTLDGKIDFVKRCFSQELYDLRTYGLKFFSYILEQQPINYIERRENFILAEVILDGNYKVFVKRRDEKDIFGERRFYEAVIKVPDQELEGRFSRGARLVLAVSQTREDDQWYTKGISISNALDEAVIGESEEPIKNIDSIRYTPQDTSSIKIELLRLDSDLREAKFNPPIYSIIKEETAERNPLGDFDYLPRLLERILK